MTKVSADLVGNNTYLYLSTTKTLRNEPVNIGSVDADYVVDLDGSIYQNRTPPPNQAYVVFVGGLDTFTNEKVYRSPAFYMTERQRITLYNIMRRVANLTDSASITSDDDTLQLIAQATYLNYCG